MLIHSKCNRLHLLTPNSPSILLPPPTSYSNYKICFSFVDRVIARTWMQLSEISLRRFFREVSCSLIFSVADFLLLLTSCIACPLYCHMAPCRPCSIFSSLLPQSTSISKQIFTKSRGLGCVFVSVYVERNVQHLKTATQNS